MTVWAFVSDIHGNLSALQRAAAVASGYGAQHYVCLGDVIGRGDPEGCVAWIRDHATVAIVGNRDLDHLQRVRPELQRVVTSWPREASGADFVVSHGDPRLHRVLNTRGERDAFAGVGSYLAERGARLWLFGHTHRARVWEIFPGSAVRVDAPTIKTDWSGQYVINVGTTGLPLPGRGPASFTLYDDATAELYTVPLQKDSAGAGAILVKQPSRSTSDSD
jgi:predicted phosphodiesterase